MASSNDIQLVLTKLDLLTALLNELKANQGSNAAQMADQISNTVKSSVIAEMNKAKEKKKTATGETKEGASNVPKKKTHPTLSQVTEKAWCLDEKASTDFEKRIKWFTSVMSKHPEVMTELLGAELIKDVEGSESYMSNSSSKKQDATSKATAFFKSIKTYLMKKDMKQWEAVSKLLVDKFNAEKAVYEATGLPQAKTESAGTAEASAAAALAACNLGPVTTTA